MFRKIKLIGQLLLLQLAAKSQNVSFERLPFNNPLQTETDTILHELVKEFFRKSHAPGLTIGITRNNSRVFYNYGYADSATQKAFTAKTVFEIGSVTKTFTANLLLQLHNKKVLSLQESILRYLPSGFANDTVLEKISPARLASHTSGLSRLPSNLDKIKEYTFKQPYQFYTKEHLYSYLKGLKKLNPGSYAYSNLGFGLLGTIEENATALSFESLLNQYIFQPLKMDDSFIDSKKNISDSATGYLYGVSPGYWSFDCLAGAGAIRSTATDILKYLEAHLFNINDQFFEAGKQASVPLFYSGAGVKIGYGWHTYEELKHRVFWHNGGTYGFSTFAAFEPQTKTGIILAANSSGVNNSLDKLGNDLLILLMGK